jgi:malonyl-ACP decarboxylase
MDTDHIGTISEIFNIAGEGFTVGGASASGNIGIIKGFQMIQLGIVDACIVVGALADLTNMELQGFYNIGAMGGKTFHDKPEKACRPFDRDHEGFIYGQASGCLILESFESAQKRNIPLLAEMLGGSIILDSNRLSDPNENGEIKAMESALKQAGITSPRRRLYQYPRNLFTPWRCNGIKRNQKGVQGRNGPGLGKCNQRYNRTLFIFSRCC